MHDESLHQKSDHVLVTYTDTETSTLYRVINADVCSVGQLVSQDLYFDTATGLITTTRPNAKVQTIDLLGKYVLAPGFLELQINGFSGIHFTSLSRNEETAAGMNVTSTSQVAVSEEQLEKVASDLCRTGVTSWWATVPTVGEEDWRKILPCLQPRSFEHGASLLGAHVEGPYLHEDKKGAHNSSFFKEPSNTAPESLYGVENLRDVIKLLTLAPELPGSIELIKRLKATYPGIAIALGHSTASYDQGQDALRAGARGLTHVFNAMNPLHHRDPGLAGLMSNNAASDKPLDTHSSPDQHLLSSSMTVQEWLARQMAALDPSAAAATKTPECYYSIIADSIHVHPAVLTTAFRTAPSKCMLITDAIELAGLPDGEYPPNGQITHTQVKSGNKATIKGTETLIGSCITLDACVRNMVKFTGCSLAEAVRCATENIADFMGEQAKGRGRLDVGCRADFTILDREGNVQQTWVAGRLIHHNHPIPDLEP